jgi:hypothetical protein
VPGEPRPKTLLACILKVCTDFGRLTGWYGVSGKAKMWIYGNPIVAASMAVHDIRVAGRIPLQILIYAAENGEARIGYDLPSSIMSRFGNPEVDAVARELDKKIVTFLIDATRRIGVGLLAYTSLVLATTSTPNTTAHRSTRPSPRVFSSAVPTTAVPRPRPTPTMRQRPSPCSLVRATRARCMNCPATWHGASPNWPPN